MRKLFGVLAVVTTTLFVVACGGGDAEPGESPTATATPGASPTRVSGDDPRAVEAAEQPGFAQFAAELARAVDANDVEYLEQRAQYQEFECTGASGFPVPPRSCLEQPQGRVVPAIPYGIWNSEGGYYSPEHFTEFVIDRFDAKAAPDAHMYAFGHHVRGASEGDDGVDIVVAGVSSPVADDQAFAPAVVFRVATAEERWSIVGVKIALVELVDDFFDWWVPWEEAFPGVLDS